MARVARHPEAFTLQPTGKQVSRRERDESYLDFVRSLPCIVTRRTEGVEAAHISYQEPKYGKLGRAKSTKESDRWAIPLCSEEHRRQHSMGERAYWNSVGIDPCIVAMSLYAAFPSEPRAILVISHIEPIRSGLWKAGRNSEGRLR
jgi:hypothetical protein